MSPIKPQNLKGFKDVLPAEMLFRDNVISHIKKVFESYGFAPLNTPALEYKEILLGYGDEAGKQIYLFEEPEGNQVGLRFDLTVPLSRVIAQYHDLPRPFKRYQVQPVWRYDKPDPGRFREFIQFDIDTIGTTSMMADTEIIAAMHESLSGLRLPHKIRFSNRKILNSLIMFAGIPETMGRHVFRILDKLEKQGLASVKLELGPGRVDESGDPIPGLGLKPPQIAKIEEFLGLPQRTRQEGLDSAANLFKDTPGAETGIREVAEIHEYLTALEIPDDKVIIDLSIARGLDYYTGPVFEAVLVDDRGGRVGSVMGGGRYDQLIGQFTGRPEPATGASIGVDRLVSAMQLLQDIQPRPSTADVLVTVMMPERIAEYARIAGRLRREGINAELYMGGEKSIGKQLQYADRQMIPVAVIAGSNEFDAGEVSIKDLDKIRREKIEIKDRKEWVKRKVGQVTVPLADLAVEVKSMLRAGGGTNLPSDH
jgi:histidyl-tRNA synthetase